MLDKSVPIKPPIDLDKEMLTDVVEHPWEKVVALPERISNYLTSDKKILDVFNELGRALLVLGLPGSGKTITLLELARDLIASAEDDPSQPFPVVVNLSTWIDPHQSLFDWLVNEIRDKYKIPEKFTRTWLGENRLLLLLDGLDEVKAENRAACVQAINAFAREYGLPGVVVTSRYEEYSQLPMRLELHAAILLKPLTDDQISAYLARAGSKLAALQSALQNDPVLRNQAQFPLMLSIMSMAYSLPSKDLPAQVLVSQEGENVETRRKYLFQTYIDAMFKRKGKSHQPYKKEQTISWLSWLAQRMIQHNHTVFLIEEMQSSWLKGLGQHLAYLLSFCLVFGFFTALFPVIAWYAWGLLSEDVAARLAGKIGFWVWVVGCIIWVFSIGITDHFTFDRRVKREQVQAKEKFVTRQALINVLIYGVMWSAIWGVMAFALSLWQAVTVDYPKEGDQMSPMILPAVTGFIIVVMVSMAGSKYTITRVIRTAESVGWSWSGALKGCLWGFTGGGLWWCVWYLFWPPPSFDNARVAFLMASLMIGVETGAILFGLHYRIIETKTVPNQGIILSIKNVCKVSFLCWGIYALTLWVFFVLFRSEWSFICGGKWKGELFSFLFSMSLVFISTLLVGGVDVLKHYILRSILCLTGQIPGRYAYFLNHASRLNLLQKVGGGYIFIHRLLLEHFAVMGNKETGNNRQVD